MSLFFGVSVRILDQRFHGRRSGDKPEWPPSPLRLFQAMVASAARMGGGRLGLPAVEALKWLERKSAESPPLILAPCVPLAAQAPQGYCLSVPNNAIDIVAKAWSRGNCSNSGDANPAKHRTMKTVRPTLLLDGNPLHYLWSLADTLSREEGEHLEILVATARKIVALGWGIDMAVGEGAILTAEQADALRGERWLPTVSFVHGLRVPVQGTLENLTARHSLFLKRLAENNFTPPAPLSNFDTIGYRRATAPPPRPISTFALRTIDDSGYRAFDTTRWALTVAGMTRYAAKCAAKRSGWPESKVGAFVLGHGESNNASEHTTVGNVRFAYLPLPSIEARGEGKSAVVGSVRRVMLAVFGEEGSNEILWARRALSGQPLEHEPSSNVDCAEGANNSIALLTLLPDTDSVAQAYLQSSASWATVTPVVLPGYDDPAHYRQRLARGTQSVEQKRLLESLSNRIDGLLRKAIAQAGLTQTLADHAQIEWRKVGYWRGTDLAERYGVPDHLKRFPRYHVRIRWRDEQGNPVNIDGPVCIGGGRFYGLGLFAALPHASS